MMANPNIPRKVGWWWTSPGNVEWFSTDGWVWKTDNGMTWNQVSGWGYGWSDACNSAKSPMIQHGNGSKPKSRKRKRGGKRHGRNKKTPPKVPQQVEHPKNSERSRQIEKELANTPSNVPQLDVVRRRIVTPKQALSNLPPISVEEFIENGKRDFDISGTGYGQTIDGTKLIIYGNVAEQGQCVRLNDGIIRLPKRWNNRQCLFLDRHTDDS